MNFNPIGVAVRPAASSFRNSSFFAHSRSLPKRTYELFGNFNVSLLFIFYCYRVLKISNSVCWRKKLHFSPREMNFRMNLLEWITKLNKRDPGSLACIHKKSSCCRMLRTKLSLWKYKFAVIPVLCNRYSHEISLLMTFYYYF